MSKRKKAASIALTMPAALAAIGLTAGNAHAAGVTKVTVTPGGHYTAIAVGSPTLTDTTTNNTLTCKSAVAAGSLPAGTHTGNTVGSVSTATFNNCSVLGLPFTAHLNKAATLVATSPTAGGVTKGVLQDISATISGGGAFACTATITGSLPGSYNNSGILTIDASKVADLTVQTATSCAGAINAGDKAYFNATYAVSPVQTVSAT